MKNYAEEYTNGLFFVLILLVFFLYRAYWPWFKPLEWRKRTWAFRRKHQNDWLFWPQNIGMWFLQGHPKFDLWLARIGTIVFVAWGIGMLIFLYWNLSLKIAP